VDPQVDATALAWSPDGTRLASAIGDVQVWDVATGQVLARYFPPLSSGVGTVKVIAWSPDGQYLAGTLASRDLNEVCLWEAGTGTLVRTWPISTQTIAWSPNSQYLATIGSQVMVWQVGTGQAVVKYDYLPTRQTIFSIAWSPDGTRLAAAADDGTVQIWKALTG